MKRSLYVVSLAAVILGWSVQLPAQTSSQQLPFKLGTFELEGRQFVGAVVRDTTVIDIVGANEVLQRQPSWVELPMAEDMKSLIARYDYGLRTRVYEIVNAVEALADQPHYVHDLGSLKILSPITNPQTILNAAVNYRAHGAEMAGRSVNIPAGSDEGVSQSIPGIWERKPGDTRHNPYFFLKPPAAIIATGDMIEAPPSGKLDWECEMTVVIGRTAKGVSVEDANDYIFGYTIENDLSDRGGRGDRRHGSDWLITKGHDTFAPLGPFIVPKEFIGDPMDLDVKFTLNGQVMQDSNTSYMWHNVYELVHFGSNIITLQPGDLVATGSPSGVGAGRTPQIFMKPGDTAVSWVENIGTLTNKVKSSEAGKDSSSY